MLRLIGSRTIFINLYLDGLNEWRGGVGWFRPPLEIKFLNEIGHAVLDGKNHLLQILPTHPSNHDGISQDEMRALFVVKKIEQDIVAGRVNRIIRATNPQPEDFILGVKRRVFFRLIGGWFISRRRRFS